MGRETTLPSPDAASPARSSRIALSERLAGQLTSPAAAGWMALGVVYVVWGSTYLAIRVADESMPPLLMAALRYLSAAALMAPYLIRHRDRLHTGRTAPWQQLGACAVVGALMLAGGNGGVSWAERTIPSGTAALLVASVPLWMVVIDRLLNRAVVGAGAGVGLAVGFAGVAVLARPSGHVHGSGTVVVVAASASWALGSLLGRRLPVPRWSLAATAAEMAFGGGVLAVAAALSGEISRFDPGAVSIRSWLALAWLVGPGSILAFTCYVLALGRLSTATVSTYAYVNPVVAVLLGAVILSEPLTASGLVGGALVVGAVVIVLARDRVRTRAG